MVTMLFRNLVIFFTCNNNLSGFVNFANSRGFNDLKLYHMQ